MEASIIPPEIQGQKAMRWREERRIFKISQLGQGTGNSSGTQRSVVSWRSLKESLHFQITLHFYAVQFTFTLPFQPLLYYLYLRACWPESHLLSTRTILLGLGLSHSLSFCLWFMSFSLSCNKYACSARSSAVKNLFSNLVLACLYLKCLCIGCTSKCYVIIFDSP